MASTSSSIGNACEPLLRGGKYDVFINHCGIDVGNSLASSIYHSLDVIGVQAFLDEELEAGEQILPATTEAIRGASVHIVILSPNYVKYPSCLDELVLVRQTRKKIIPIFYHVEPYHMGHRKEIYSEAFSKAFSTYEREGYPPQQLKDWKEALVMVSQLNGLEVTERENDEGLLLRKIVYNVKRGMTDLGKCRVFINHRGIDVKNSLASTIYHTLGAIGVRAFLDREELKAGEAIFDAIKEAVSDALIHIVILSPNYAQSKWCLDELTLILRTGKKIIPVFYHVEPSDVRRGVVYSETFSKHEEEGKFTPQKLEQWKKALSTVTEIKGYKVNDRYSNTGPLVKKIVDDVKKEMKKMALLHVAKHPVGLDEAIAEFHNFVEIAERQDVKIVGIAGTGGCGKTTLATAYFNWKRSSYGRSSFLFDVKDAATTNRLHDLQNKLSEDLLNITGLPIHDASEGKKNLEHRSVRALIVLDDVDDIHQIETLLPFLGNLPSDSLVIITTRDSGVILSLAPLFPSVSV